MDVNAIGKNVNFVNVYSAGSDVSESYTNTVAGDNSKVSSNREIEKGQEAPTNNGEDQVDKKELDKAVEEFNKISKHDKRHAEYSVHKDLGTIMVKIIDDQTKDVILETPPEKLLDLIATICQRVGIIDKKV